MEWQEFMEWAWTRHHNVWSWIIRPVIILAFCYAAYKRKGWGIALAVLFFPLSAILFPAPAEPRPEIAAYLAKEREMVENASLLQAVGFVIAVGLYLWLLALAFWKRSLWRGMVVVALGAVAKVAGSLWLWPEEGGSSIAPAILTVVVVTAVLGLVWWIQRRRDGSRDIATPP